MKRRSRAAADPTQPNLRQVHLVEAERLAELAEADVDVAPEALGQDVLTEGLNLLALPRGAILRIEGADLEATGLGHPCARIETFRPGLLAQALRREDGRLVRRPGVMANVRAGGEARAGDPIRVTAPTGPNLPLERV